LNKKSRLDKNVLTGKHIKQGDLCQKKLMQTANALMDVSVTETAKPVRSTTENPVRAQTAAKTVATAKKITNAETFCLR
jgi:hypothetical protein